MGGGSQLAASAAGETMQQSLRLPAPRSAAAGSVGMIGDRYNATSMRRRRNRADFCVNSAAMGGVRTGSLDDGRRCIGRRHDLLC